MLRADLRSGAPLQWGILLEVFNLQKVNLERKLVDACLSGATRDKKLLEVAASGLLLKSDDQRWKKIFDAELKDKQAAFKENRDKLFQEVQIFQQEGMHDELKESLSKILHLFPADEPAKEIRKAVELRESEQSLDEIKRKNQNRPAKLPKFEKPNWPELGSAINKIKGGLDLDSTYHLSIGLFEMEFHSEALSLLRLRKPQWTHREKFLELEIILAQELFAEALEITQTMMRDGTNKPQTVLNLLYLTAKAYYGLEDVDQAFNILRAVTKQSPDFKDAAILLKEWERQIR